MGLHHRQLGTQAGKGPAQIDGNDCVKSGHIRIFDQGQPVGDARIVDREIQPAMAGTDRIHMGLHGRRVADVKCG